MDNNKTLLHRFEDLALRPAFRDTVDAVTIAAPILAFGGAIAYCTQTDPLPGMLKISAAIVGAWVISFACVHWHTDIKHRASRRREAERFRLNR